MSYGVIASKSAQIMVETAAGTSTADADVVLDRFQTIWGPTAWVPGRLTLTSLHANFIPNRAGRGMAMMDLALREVTGVEVAGGRVQKVLGIRTPAHVVHVRCLGAGALAQQLTELVEAAHKPTRRR